MLDDSSTASHMERVQTTGTNAIGTSDAIGTVLHSKSASARRRADTVWYARS